MTTKEYEKLAAELESRGYKKYTYTGREWKHESQDWDFAKSVKDDKGENLYQIRWLIYDHRTWKHQDAYFKAHPWNADIKIYVAHAVELHLWHHNYTIDEAETAAERLFELAKELKLHEDL